MKGAKVVDAGVNTDTECLLTWPYLSRDKNRNFRLETECLDSTGKEKAF